MTTATYRHRRDPQLISQGWEAAAALIGAAMVGFGLAALAGLGLASAIWGRGWVWPHGTATISHVLGGLLQGHPGRGLAAAARRRVATPGPTYGCIAVTEITLLALMIVIGLLIVRYHRPGDARGGMASRHEAEQALGLRRLRSSRSIIRPDLYGKDRPGGPS